MPVFDKDLTLFHDDNGAFTDFSLSGSDYLRDDTSITLVAAEDYIYAGLYKPFADLYAELTTAASGPHTLTGEYYDGSSFVAVSNLRDDTSGLTRSGFIQWARPSDWESTTVNGEDLYWFRFKTDTDTSAMSIRGLNVVFSDDNDLSAELRTITRLLASGDTSFIAYHVSARDEIVQTLRNRGKSKQQSASVQPENMTKWDILDTGEIRQAAKYLALSKIAFAVSDGIDDKWHQRFVDWRGEYGKAFNTWFLSLDLDDDGVKDNDEALRTSRIRVVRL